MTPSHQTDRRAAEPGCIRKTGGLRWHARALRHWHLHDPFRREIASFLESWQPAAKDLVLVGPSGGWFLPATFLKRFSRLTLIELDSSAPIFFNLRHGLRLRRARTSTQWVLGDFVDYLPLLLRDSPDCAVLFCNVLGQLGLERSDYDKQLERLPSMLAGRPWATFHDRFSAVVSSPGIPKLGIQGLVSDRPLEAELLRQPGFTGEWIDHGTGQVLPPASTRRYIPWWISPSRFHWIEVGSMH